MALKSFLVEWQSESEEKFNLTTRVEILNLLSPTPTLEPKTTPTVDKSNALSPMHQLRLSILSLVIKFVSKCFS